MKTAIVSSSSKMVKKKPKQTSKQTFPPTRGVHLSTVNPEHFLFLFNTFFFILEKLSNAANQKL